MHASVAVSNHVDVEQQPAAADNAFETAAATRSDAMLAAAATNYAEDEQLSVAAENTTENAAAAGSVAMHAAAAGNHADVAQLPAVAGNASQNAAAGGSNALHATPSVNHVGRTVGNTEAALTGEIFPGRPLIRPRIVFKNTGEDEWRDDCLKDYRYNRSHSPGLFTVVCSCKHPKLLGASIMDEAESLSTAINALFTRFNPLPQTVFYDNACNLTKSVGLRFRWMFEDTLFVCDRFHYTGHRCSSLFDPDIYESCDKVPTSGAEALNRQWKPSRTHIRFLSADNLVPFVYVRMFFLNLRAKMRERCKGVDVENRDLYGLAHELIPCKCHRCQAELDADREVGMKFKTSEEVLVDAQSILNSEWLAEYPKQENHEADDALAASASTSTEAAQLPAAADNVAVNAAASGSSAMPVASTKTNANTAQLPPAVDDVAINAAASESSSMRTASANTNANTVQLPPVANNVPVSTTASASNAVPAAVAFNAHASALRLRTAIVKARQHASRHAS